MEGILWINSIKRIGRKKVTTVVDTCAKAPNRTEPWIEIELKLNEKISTKSFVRQFYVVDSFSCLPRDTGESCLTPVVKAQLSARR